MTSTEGRAIAETCEHEEAKRIRRGQQFYAKIKRSSKHYDQNEWARVDPKRWGGFPFPVFVEAGDPAGYVLHGGPGGKYRLSDVNLYIIEGGRELKIK